MARVQLSLSMFACALLLSLVEGDSFFQVADQVDDVGAAIGESAIIGSGECSWPRGGVGCCGTLRTPGAAHGWRNDETDHCFPASASDHHVCCVDIQSVDNEYNEDDATVAHHNPLSGPIRRNSDPSSYSWCTCSESICVNQLKGRVAWVGKPRSRRSSSEDM